jgi:hypothetical protein
MMISTAKLRVLHGSCEYKIISIQMFGNPENIHLINSNQPVSFQQPRQPTPSYMAIVQLMKKFPATNVKDCHFLICIFV